MSKSNFQVASFKYENLSNRMERLRRSQKHSNSTTDLRSGSVDRNNENKTIPRTISTALLTSQNLNQTILGTHLQEQSCLDIDSRYSGRVAKNTGIRKYNQRMLKEVSNINKATPPIYSALQTDKKASPIRNQTQVALNFTANTQNVSSPVKKNPFNRKTQVNQYVDVSKNINVQIYERRKYEPQMKETKSKIKQQRFKLEPGKIYTRQELQKQFGV